MCGTRRAVLSFANRNVVDANGSALYNSPRLGVDAIHPTGLPGRLAMTLRVTSALALARDRGYDGQRMGADTVQPSRRLAHPTTRLPRAASRAATRATTDRSAPVLTAPLCPSTRPLYQAPLPGPSTSRSPRIAARARRRLQHRGSGRLRPQRSWIPAPQLTVTEPTADVAGQPLSLLGRPPPRVAL